MSDATMPFDTTLYNQMPISAFVYETLLNEDGSLLDYRIVYGNRVFAQSWARIYHSDQFMGAMLIRDHLMDDNTLQILGSFRAESPRSFSTYLPFVNLHLHFEPMRLVQQPYTGFFVTNITDYEEQEARVHFLRNIRQMKNIAVLLKVHDSGHLEPLFVSDEYAEMMEGSPEEVMLRMNSEGFLAFTHPEDRILVRSALEQRISDDGSMDLTIQKITCQGHPIWCNVHYAFIDDFHEHYIYCTYFNVTVLKEYEERLRSVYVSLGNNFYQTNDRALGIFRVNVTRDSIEDMQGTDLFDTDSLNRSYSELMRLRAEHYPIERERKAFWSDFCCQALTDSFLKGQSTITQTLYSRRQNGSACFVSCTACLTRHPLTGDVVAFLSEQACNDVKVREILLDKILIHQFDMVSYLSDGRYGVVIGDAAENRRGSIFPIVRNGEYRQYLDNQIRPVLCGDEAQQQAQYNALSLETISAQVRQQEPYVVNISCALDGEIYHKQFDFYAVDPDANFYIFLKSDTTAIQRVQEARNLQLRDALTEAQQANVAKTAFLSRMSHEIRTPMNAIIGLDNIALQEPRLPEDTRTHLEKIGESARYLLVLINDILDMSRIESGRMVLKNEEFSFPAFLEQINTLAYSQCADKGLEYDCLVHGTVAEHYIGDATKLKQVLVNILGNAVKFTAAPGSVSLSVERTVQSDTHSTLRFVVRDTGIGMDPEYLPHIFEAFSQEDPTNTNVYGGSGLGLAISKNIIEMMNGSIAVTSQKGVGSLFTVDVMLKNTAPALLRQQDFHIRPQDLRILVIDDDPVACQHASVVLEELGIAADTCLSGAEALEMVQLRHARRDAYNLILVDLRMPEQDGVEVTRQIRQMIGDTTAVVILTAYSWAEVEEEAIQAGVDSFMRKPLFASTVLDEFQQVLQLRQLRQPEQKVQVPLEGRRILLAEDMLINAEIVIMLLNMREMEVEHVENGQLAVERFAQQPEGWFDAILMDVRMPVMDGLTAAEAIRALDRLDSKTIPIIAMTANAFDEDVQRSLQAGMNAHLSKPVEPERLFATLSGLIKDIH